MGNSGLHQRISCFIGMIFGGSRCALNLFWITSNFLAPAVKDFHFVDNGCCIAEAMPHISILSGNAKRFLFTTATDQDGYRTVDWARNVLFPTLLDDRDVGF